MTDTPTLMLDVLPTEIGPPVLTLVRLNDGRFAATKRFPVDLTKAEVTFDTDRQRVRLEFPTQWVNFTTLEAVIAQSEAAKAIQGENDHTGPVTTPWRDAETSGHMVGQAATVITAMANGAVSSSEIQRALTYFAGGVYNKDFLPFPATPLTLPPDGDASDRHTSVSPGETFVRQGRRLDTSLLPKVIEAADFIGEVLPDAKPSWALTCEWPDGTESVEYVSHRVACLLCPGSETFETTEEPAGYAPTETAPQAGTLED